MSIQTINDGQLSDLIQRVREGDVNAQSDLYSRFAKAMFNTAYRILQDSFEAEDVVQEAFISAFRNIKSLESGDLFSAWLKRIVVNHSLNAIKQRRSYEQLLQTVEVEEKPSAEMHQDQLKVEHVLKAYAQLPVGYRTILSLYLFEGYDHEEIGEILGISSATSRSQYNRGKQKLKSILNDMK